jgi:hypothetical protein
VQVGEDELPPGISELADGSKSDRAAEPLAERNIPAVSRASSLRRSRHGREIRASGYVAICEEKPLTLFW